MTAQRKTVEKAAQRVLDARAAFPGATLADLYDPLAMPPALAAAHAALDRAVDNIGLGFWEQQIQGAVSWYPWADKRMAVSGALTYGIPQKKEDFDLTPGQNLTFNWGISQYLPLNKTQTLLLEVGPAGYDSWQVTSDSGSAASGGLDQVHAVGGQFGFTYVPWMLSVNFHGFYEYAARGRFQGQSFGLNIAKMF